MSRNSKLIASVIAASKEDMPALPFQRGAARKAMIARRSAKSDAKAEMALKRA